MKILITAGNTQTPVDRVRCITNIFTGRTGTRIAQEAQRRGHDVHLLTSHPDLAAPAAAKRNGGTWTVSQFRTFDELHELMATHVPAVKFDAIIHCAAISDFQIAGAFAPAFGTRFDPDQLCWHGADSVVQLVDVQAGKVKSQHSELWLRLIPTPKLVDKIRKPWGFGGILVKFKLEVDVTERQLAAIAAESRRCSDADLIVANTLAGMHDWALLGSRIGDLVRLDRPVLAERLLDEIESLLPEHSQPTRSSSRSSDSPVAAFAVARS